MLIAINRSSCWVREYNNHGHGTMMNGWQDSGVVLERFILEIQHAIIRKFNHVIGLFLGEMLEPKVLNCSQSVAVVSSTGTN